MYSVFVKRCCWGGAVSRGGGCYYELLCLAVDEDGSGCHGGLQLEVFGVGVVEGEEEGAVLDAGAGLTRR